MPAYIRDAIVPTGPSLGALAYAGSRFSDPYGADLAVSGTVYCPSSLSAVGPFPASLAD